LDFGTHRTTYETLFSEFLGVNSTAQGAEYIQSYIDDEAHFARLDDEAIDRINMNDVDLPTDSDTEYVGPLPFPEEQNNKQQHIAHPIATFCQSPSSESNLTPSIVPCASTVCRSSTMAAENPP
jgi:hypothetical protein